MEKRIYICNRCGKEFDDKEKLEQYKELGFRSEDPHYCGCSYSYGSASGDLCKECNKLLRAKMSEFLNSLRTDFKFD